MYDKSKLIKESFRTEINKLISIYGSISYFGKKIDEIAKIVSTSNPLDFNAEKKNEVNNYLNFQLTIVNGTNKRW